MSRHGEPGTFDYRLEPEEIAEMGLETRPQAYERGKADGVVEGHEAGVAAGRQALQSEIDIARGKSITRARWGVTREQEDPLEWMIVNFAKGAVATRVTIDTPPEQFVFLSEADWGDLTGFKKATFNGSPRPKVASVTFTIDWDDEHGNRQSAVQLWEFP